MSPKKKRQLRKARDVRRRLLVAAKRKMKEDRREAERQRRSWQSPSGLIWDFEYHPLEAYRKQLETVEFHDWKDDGF